MPHRGIFFLTFVRISLLNPTCLMITFLRHFKISILLIGLLILANGCKNEDEPTEPTTISRVMLIYMAADNNLSNDSYNNIESIIKGANGKLGNGKLIVYQDPRGSNARPQLIEIYQDKNTAKSRVLKQYEEHNSASGEILSQVIQDAFSLYQSKSKGLMLWSHGTSWLPADKKIWTRSFGQDGTNEMEMDELKAALPNSFFDFIIFDACLMSSVEVCYQLKDKAKYIVASPVEIFADGFPYELIIKDMFSDKSEKEFLTSICNTYYDFYFDEPYCKDGICSHLASISLIQTSGLDQLTQLSKEIIKNRMSEIENLKTENIQPLYHHYPTQRPILFDYKDFFNQITTEEEKSQISSLLEDVILYQKHTEYAYSSSLGGGFSLEKYSGLSIYIPKANTPELNSWYFSLDWGNFVYN